MFVKPFSPKKESGTAGHLPILRRMEIAEHAIYLRVLRTRAMAAVILVPFPDGANALPVKPLEYRGSRSRNLTRPGP